MKLFEESNRLLIDAYIVNTLYKNKQILHVHFAVYGNDNFCFVEGPRQGFIVSAVFFWV